ncbi:hypothetical protein [Corynebacterium sp. ACRPH]|uniref:hypothetical protein n=1 Tax=Corynebacterium sp. ACRPH TaxID=2918199 RepID=UPI001EF22839|nr:hypothetical protein [Corynebacterium sp. ACRPH]MCG7457566.1 hypothetical protein [Corynebacterium sp. ACRPH]
MTIVNPYDDVPGVDERANSIIRQAIPDFSGIDYHWNLTIKKNSTLAQRKKAIELLRPYAADSFSDPATRQYFAVAITLGAKDLDVTPIVDELEQYQNTTDPTALEMIEQDQSHMMDVVAPTNFEQFNRYLRLEGEALMYGQTLFLCKAVKTKSFRMAPDFQWLKTSRFAKHPQSVYILTFMGKHDRVKWVSEEALAAKAALEEQ